MFLAGCLAIDTPSLARMYVGKGTAVPLAASGQKGPLVWSATGLPPGVTLNSSTGVLSGVGESPGTFPVAITATDPAGDNASVVKNLNLTIGTSSMRRFGSTVDETSRASISGDGRYLVYAAQTTSGCFCDTVFEYDRTSGTTTARTSTSPSADGATEPVISNDGQFIAYHDYATNQIKVWDRSTGATTQLTHGNESVSIIKMSGDGQYLVFGSASSDLVPGDTNGLYDIFLVDRTTAAVVRVTNADAGGVGYDGGMISQDGMYVTYSGGSSDLVPGDTNGYDDVFVWNRATGVTTRITDGNGESFSPSISGDGGQIAFVSRATNLVPGDTGENLDIFVWTRATGKTARITTSAQELGSNDPLISADGQTVIFNSDNSDLVPADTNGKRDLFMWDRPSRGTTRITDSNADSAPLAIAPLAISSDGTGVVFSSLATNLVSGDSNGYADVFLWAPT